METVSPEDVGFSSERLARVSELSRRYVDDGKLAGLVTMLSRGGKTFHFEAAGAMDVEAGKDMELDTIFRIYSMTKPITSAAVMMFHEAGHFHLDDPVSTFIPELGDLQVCTGMGETGPRLSRLERPMTVRHLLTHTAGLSYGFAQDTPVDEMYRKSEPRRYDGTLKEMVTRLGELPLVSQPGTRWRYSLATDVLGYLVEVVSGQTFDRFLSDRIFQPLGMWDTGFHVPEEKLDRLASVYGPPRENGIAPWRPPRSAATVSRRRCSQGEGASSQRQPITCGSARRSWTAERRTGCEFSAQRRSASWLETTCHPV